MFILCSILYYQYFHFPPTSSIISPIKPPFSPGTSLAEQSAHPPPGFLFTAFLGRFPKFPEPQAFAFFGLLHILKQLSPQKSGVEGNCHVSVFLGSLSFHNKDLEQQTLKPSVHHSSRVLDKPCYSS